MATSVRSEKQLDPSKNCSASHTIIGAIHCSSIIFVAMRNPPPKKLKVQESQTMNTTKPKKKLVRGKVQRDGDIIIEVTVVYVDVEESSTSENKKPITKGTITAHFVKFMNEILDIMDTDKSFVDSYLVMDNCII